MSEFLTLQGKSVPFARVVVRVEECELDPRNPRIQYMIGQRAGQVSQDELDSLIWEKDAVKALGQSIYQNGGVYEPVILQRNRSNGRYMVREGNCRKVACHHLMQQYPGDPRFATMPAMIFDVELTEEDLAVLLADMHVAGKIRWDAYEQAKHVSDLYNIYGKTFDWLSSHLRLSKSKITELLLAYKATAEFLALHPNQSVRRFSFFQEIIKKRALREQFLGDPAFKERFHRWLVEERITDARQVRDLPTILEHPEPTKTLDTEGFIEAQRVLMRTDPSLESDLFWQVKVTTAKLRAAPFSDIQDLKAGHPGKTIMLRDLHRAIEDLATMTGMRM